MSTAPGAAGHEQAEQQRDEAEQRGGTADITVRYLASRPSGIVAPSRTAAIGSTRVARIAGRRLASTVTTTPTRMATMIVRALTTVPVLGSVTLRR